MQLVRVTLILSLLITLCACFQRADSPRGFSLPPGELAAGEQAFYKYECFACHTLDGFDDSIVLQEITTKVPLGGKVRGVTTYGELVTSIINPSHKLTNRLSRSQTTDSGMSKMTNYNDIMTVTELIDVVTFLQPKYEILQYTPTAYEFYYLGDTDKQSESH